MKKTLFLLLSLFLIVFSGNAQIYIFPCADYSTRKASSFSGEIVSVSIVDSRDFSQLQNRIRKNKFTSEELIEKVKKSITESFPEVTFLFTKERKHIHFDIEITEYQTMFLTNSWDGTVGYYVVMRDSRSGVKSNKRIENSSNQFNNFGYTSAKETLSIAYSKSTRELIDFIDDIGSSTITSANSQDEERYTQYLTEKIATLDPIEGIYDVHQDLSLIIQGRRSNEKKDGKVIILRIDGISGENTFKIIPLSNGLTFDGRDFFERIGETNIYKFTQVGNDYTLSERTAMTNLYGFTLSITLTPEVFSGMGLDPHICAGMDNYTFIKEFPTKSLYEGYIRNDNQPKAWSGTGWAIGSEYLVTNYHVVDEARTISIKGIGGDLNTGYSAEVMATDKTNDIAVLKITDSQFKGFGTIPYAVSSRIADKGEGVFVLGYPMTQVLGNEVKYTAGEINSRTGFQGDVATYQISAPVTHGNSGGPMFDNRGNVIGIVNSGITDKEIAENVGYAIKISYLKILIESAGLDITLPQNNTIANLSKQEKIKKVEKFVYYIECSK
jgi:S1-C subfamily serine protease